MKNSVQPKVSSNHEDGVDLISSMPDAILLLILSRLPIIELAIRSSILSRRWMYLWTAIPSVGLYYPEGKPIKEELKRNEFKEFVYWVLANRSADLDNFTLYCFDNYFNMLTVWRWIHIAVAKNVKQLDFMYWPDTTIELPHCLVASTSLKLLKLSLFNCGLRLPNYKGFPALKVLHLSFLDLLEDQDLVKKILENCSLLEDLTLKACYMNRLDLLCISCPNVKKLTIKNCRNDNERMCGGIKIFCPKLVFLKVSGPTAYNFFFEGIDALKEAVIVPHGLPLASEGELMGNTKSVVFPGIYHVESLKIDLYFFCQCIYAARDPGLPNLRTLVLTTTIDAFTMDKFNQILSYYPKLESLKLIVEKEFEGLEYLKLDEAATRKILTPDHLKRMEFFKFNGKKLKLVTEKPKSVDNHNGTKQNTLLKMVFSWDN